MTGDWITERQSGRTKTREVRPKYELLTSHVARRTFVTMCLRKGMSPEDIRAVTGHTTADMMMKYVKFDDESKREKMSILNENAQSGVETVFDHTITDDERIRLGIPTRETYLEIFEGDTASVNATSLFLPTSEATSMPAQSTSNGLLLINLMKFSNS
jgi:hypothetical protein